MKIQNWGSRNGVAAVKEVVQMRRVARIAEVEERIRIGAERGGLIESEMGMAVGMDSGLCIDSIRVCSTPLS